MLCRGSFPHSGPGIVSTLGLALSDASGYAGGMKINTLAQLTDLCEAAAADAGCDPAHAPAIASVIARHAMGQGLAYGDDWGWVVELYDAAAVREICEAADEAGW